MIKIRRIKMNMSEEFIMQPKNDYVFKRIFGRKNNKYI